jgi:hypothetical protein
MESSYFTDQIFENIDFSTRKFPSAEYEQCTFRIAGLAT